MARKRKGIIHGLYAWSVILLGYTLMVFILRTYPVNADFVREYVVFLILGVLAEWFVVALPQGSLSVGFAVVLTVFLLFDTGAAVLISVISALIGNSLLTKDGSIRPTLFNGAQYTISAGGAAAAYYYVGGLVADKISVSNIIPLLVFVVVYFLINQVLVSIFLWPSYRHYTVNMWGAAFKWDIYTYLFATPVGLLMFLVYTKIGILGATLLFLPILTLKFFLRLHINLEMANKELSVLYQVAQSLGASLDMAETLGLILSESRKVVPYHTGIIYLWHEEEQVLIPAAIRSPYADKLKRLTFPLGEGVVGMAAKTGEPEIIYDTRKDPRFRVIPGITQFLRSVIVVPLLVEKKIIGVATIGRREPYAYGPKQLQILTILGGQAAVAMANALLYKKIEKLAITDGLTKVYNHRYFYKKLEEECERSRRYGSNFSIIMVDIDYFKRFNDEFGHKSGDMALLTVAQIVKKNTRNIDTVARYGGEEFSVLLPETGREDAQIVAERIRKAINDTLFKIADDKPPVGVTVSIGVSSFPIDTKDPLQVIELADQALYYSKEHGKNRVTLWAQMKLTPVNG